MHDARCNDKSGRDYCCKLIGLVAGKIYLVRALLGRHELRTRIAIAAHNTSTTGNSWEHVCEQQDESVIHGPGSMAKGDEGALGASELNSSGLLIELLSPKSALRWSWPTRRVLLPFLHIIVVGPHVQSK